MATEQQRLEFYITNEHYSSAIVRIKSLNKQNVKQNIMGKDEDIALREFFRHSLSMQEEQKKDNAKIYDLVHGLSGDMRVYNEKHLQHTQDIVDAEKKIFDLQTAIQGYRDDRNMIIGASKLGAFLGALGGAGGVSALIIAWFKH